MSQDTDRTALLVMDVQQGILDRLDDTESIKQKYIAVIDAAHKKNIPVVYVVVGFREGFPEVSSLNKSFSTIKDSGSPGLTNPVPAIKPDPNDIVVTKRRVGAFSGSDLEVVLSGQDIKHLVLTGISTSGVVLSTIRFAADKDYKLSVLSDLCFDFDPEVHDVLIEKVFPRQADVMTSKQWVDSL